MAYTAVVEKVNVSKVGANLYSASIKLTVNDGTSDVFACSASARYNNNAPDLVAVKNVLQAELKEQWDKWADENGIYSATAFDTMVSEIQSATNTYVNQ